MSWRSSAPDIAVKDKVLEDEPGDVEDDEEGEGGDAACLDDDRDDVEVDGNDVEGDGDEVEGDGNYVQDDNDDDDKGAIKIDDEKNLHVKAPRIDQSSCQVDQAVKGSMSFSKKKK